MTLRHAAPRLALLALLAADAACDDGAYVWRLPPGAPLPIVPADNPMSAMKVELGRRLFYDKRLSGNQTFACASCHEQRRAFTDGRAQAVGSTGERHPRSAMSVVGVGYLAVLGWADPSLTTLEAQAPVPILGEHPVELGLAGREAELLARLAVDPRYPTLFAGAFPREVAPITFPNVARALAAFERTLVSASSRFDRYVGGAEPGALSAAEIRGLKAFQARGCAFCHLGPALTHAERLPGDGPRTGLFHNTGLYNLDGKGAYPPEDPGLFARTGRPEDMGRFRTPTLRNIAVTAPYMHDGSIATLDEVLDHYSAGGRTITSGAYAGDGSKSPLKTSLIQPFELLAEERSDLLAFFGSLTDEAFLSDPAFSDPFAAEGPGLRP